MIRSEKAHLPFSVDSHPGMSGKNNEDSYGVFAYQIQAKTTIPVFVGIVSDGIGGHRAGEVASNIAVNVIKEHMEASDGSNITSDIRHSIVEASDRIQVQSQSNSEQKGMGATIACVALVGNRLYTATVGDSPIFLMRGNQIQQLSIDHTWIQEALDSGLLRPDQVEGHPNAHVIRRYLGGVKPPEVDFRMRLTGREPDEQARANQGTPVIAGDRILLCSDGLTDLVKPHEILSIVREKPKDAAVAALIDLANQRGGHDNITILLIEIPESIAAVSAAVPGKTPVWQYVTIGCLGALILAVVGGFFILSYFKNRPVQTPTPSPSLTFTTMPTVMFTPTPKPSETSTINPDGTLTVEWMTQEAATQTESAIKQETQQAVDQTQQAGLSASQTSQVQTMEAQSTPSTSPTGSGTPGTSSPPEGGGTDISNFSTATPEVDTQMPNVPPPQTNTVIVIIGSPTISITYTITPWFRTWTPRPTMTRWPTLTPRPTWKPIFP